LIGRNIQDHPEDLQGVGPAKTAAKNGGGSNQPPAKFGVPLATGPSDAAKGGSWSPGQRSTGRFSREHFMVGPPALNRQGAAGKKRGGAFGYIRHRGKLRGRAWRLFENRKRAAAIAGPKNTRGGPGVVTEGPHRTAAVPEYCARPPRAGATGVPTGNTAVPQKSINQKISSAPAAFKAERNKSSGLYTRSVE